MPEAVLAIITPPCARMIGNTAGCDRGAPQNSRQRRISNRRRWLRQGLGQTQKPALARKKCIYPAPLRGGLADHGRHVFLPGHRLG